MRGRSNEIPMRGFVRGQRYQYQWLQNCGCGNVFSSNSVVVLLRGCNCLSVETKQVNTQEIYVTSVANLFVLFILQFHSNTVYRHIKCFSAIATKITARPNPHPDSNPLHPQRCKPTPLQSGGRVDRLLVEACLRSADRDTPSPVNIGVDRDIS